MGIVDRALIDVLAMNTEVILKAIKLSATPPPPKKKVKEIFKTKLGKLFQDDCVAILKTLPNDHVDMIFADPPFNLKKFYLSGIDDDLASVDYIKWCETWLEECVRVLKPGGSLFLWNLPRWNTYLSSFLNDRLTFRHWIATDIKLSLPIQGKLYPAHYSLLYYCKGPKPNVYKPDRLPMETCKSCFNEVKDYGGYKNKMNPAGINLSDVWYDIPPVRHQKYKTREEANELSIKLLDRVIEMSTEPGQIVLDPFGGSGTTFAVAEIKGRKWLGMELGPVEGIKERFEHLAEEKGFLDSYRSSYNQLFPSKIKAKRKQLGIWTEDTFKEEKTLSV
jgi:site-specific DNA-methyltransferase (adenine-specific)